MAGKETTPGRGSSEFGEPHSRGAEHSASSIPPAKNSPGLHIGVPQEGTFSPIGDVSGMKDTGTSPETEPLSPETHRSIVRRMLSLTNSRYSFDLTSGELFDFSDAVESGRLDAEAVVGKEVNTSTPLGDGPYSSFASIETFNEAFGVSDLAPEEKEIATVGILIDHAIDAPPNRYAHMHLRIKADGRIRYGFFSTDESDADQTRLIEDETKEWGLTMKLSSGETTTLEGDYDEKQGKQLLKKLQEISEE